MEKLDWNFIYNKKLISLNSTNTYYFLGKEHLKFFFSQKKGIVFLIKVELTS